MRAATLAGRSLASSPTTRAEGLTGHLTRTERECASTLARAAAGVCTVYGQDGSRCDLAAGHDGPHDLGLWPLEGVA